MVDICLAREQREFFEVAFKVRSVGLFVVLKCLLFEKQPKIRLMEYKDVHRNPWQRFADQRSFI
jgi:hypothetical protein